MSKDRAKNLNSHQFKTLPKMFGSRFVIDEFIDGFISCNWYVWLSSSRCSEDKKYGGVEDILMQRFAQQKVVCHCSILVLYVGDSFTITNYSLLLLIKISMIAKFMKTVWTKLEYLDSIAKKMVALRKKSWINHVIHNWG